ncbi:isoprenylcysteine carboxyl methyltransferase family protein [Paenibacillus sp. oral taxon 786 str. D14]|nr:isoprenylcysteine carboxyl methyltransferase family protein [Paenibacillus sp. oral taxon 786 str. D14]
MKSSDEVPAALHLDFVQQENTDLIMAEHDRMRIDQRCTGRDQPADGVHSLRRTLGRFWTFKIYIAKGHQLIETPLFRRVKHPNYYLNIIPEVLSFAIISQGWVVFTPLFVLHLITLFNRIRLEEKIMKQTFRGYK